MTLLVRIQDGDSTERFMDDLNLFRDALLHVDAADDGLLQWWDPYGDVIYNSHQAAAVAEELKDLLVVCPEETHDAIRAVLRLADRTAAGRHRYLHICGD